MSSGAWLRALAIAIALGASGLLIARSVSDVIAVRKIATWTAKAKGASGAAPAEAPPAAEPAIVAARDAPEPATKPPAPPAVPTPEPEKAPEHEEIAASSAELPRCDIEARVAASLYNEQHPERSWVVLRGPTVSSKKAREENARVSELVVAEIGPDTVILRNRGEPCWLGMFNEHSHAKVERERAESRKHKSTRSSDRTKRKRKRKASR